MLYFATFGSFRPEHLPTRQGDWLCQQSWLLAASAPHESLIPLANESLRLVYNIFREYPT